MYQKLEASVQYIQSRCALKPLIGIVLGSGLGVFTQKIENPTILSFSEIPNFHPTNVEGHSGKLILGTIHGVPVVVLQGRLHAYEGYPMQEVVLPVRVLGLMGIQFLFLTNAAGGINEKFFPGQLVLIKDHINLMGINPLIGPNLSQLGPRFPDMTEAYNKDVINLCQETANEISYPLQSGIYCSLLGPTYETPAEIRMLRLLGGDMVGMSTVPETIAAHHMGIKVCGLSCITNLGAGITEKKLSHDEIKDVAARVIHPFSELIVGTIKKIGENFSPHKK